MKKTREQKIEKLEKKLAKLKIPKVNYSFNPSNVYPGNLYQAFATPKLEVGKWYKSPKYGKAIFYITNITNKKVDAYGLNYKYEWQNEKEFGDSISEDYELATDKEVETALISEAKKRGFKNGEKIDQTKMNTDFNTKVFKLQTDEEMYYCKGLNTLSFGNYWLFKEGVWAEIIEDSKPKINGYEMEVVKGCNGGDVIKFGCQKFDAKNVIDFYKYAEKLNLNSFSFGQYNVEIYELKEVVDYLNK